MSARGYVDENNSDRNRYYNNKDEINSSSNDTKMNEMHNVIDNELNVL